MASMSPAPNRAVRSFTMMLALSMIVVAALAMAGCNDDGDDARPRITPNPVFEPSPVPTLVEPGTINLTPTAGNLGYTVDMPPGWIAAPPEQFAGEDVYSLMDGERIVAQMTALCETPLSDQGRQLEPLEYTQKDIVYIEQLRGIYDPPEPFFIRETIAAAHIRYQTTLGPVTVRQKVVHFTIDACHWTLRLRVFAPGDVLPYETLFDRVVQTFTPNASPS